MLGTRGESQQLGSGDNTQSDPYQSSQDTLQNSATSGQSTVGGNLPPMNDLDDDIPF